jgi:hypothetical protein
MEDAMASEKVIFVASALLASVALAQDQKVYGDYQKIKIEDDVRWIDETPARPEDYIGQVFLVKKDSSTIPYFAPVPVPILVEDTPAIKKSILIRSSKEGSVSFLDFFKLSGEKEAVYQFQIVNSRKWSADTKSKEYLKAIAAYRNDPTTASIFDSPDFSGVVMVTAVVAKKIWYKIYKKEGAGGGATYYVKVEGKEYFSSEDYEEAIKYGLLLRPLNGWGFVLPKTILNAEQLTTANVKLPNAVFQSLDRSIKAMATDKVMVINR